MHRIFPWTLRCGLLSICVGSTAFLSQAQAASPGVSLGERIGRLELTDILVEPQFRYYEPQTGGFEWGSTYVTARWMRDDMLSATVMIGNDELLGQPARFAPIDDADIALLEAYGEAETSLGQARMGLVPIPFGTEGGHVESTLLLPRSLLFSENWIGLRDLGFSYAVENEGFASEWVVHNGEGGADRDNQIWFTSRWSWRNEHVWLGVSGQAGRTTPESTQAALGSPVRTFAEAGLDTTEASKFRAGNVFVQWNGRPVGLTVEATSGETFQLTGRSKFHAAHGDISFRLSPSWALLGRYDYFDPSDRFTENRLDEITFGFAASDPYETSVIYLLGKRVLEQGRPDARHEVLLIWRLTPLVASSIAK